MRKFLRKSAFFMALAGIGVEIFFAERIEDTWDNIVTYFLVLLMLYNFEDDNAYITRWSRLDKFQKVHWQWALRSAKYMDVLAFAVLVLQFGLTWIHWTPET